MIARPPDKLNEHHATKKVPGLFISEKNKPGTFSCNSDLRSNFYVLNPARRDGNRQIIRLQSLQMKLDGGAYLLFYFLQSLASRNTTGQVRYVR